MTLIFRASKGSPLTADEVDNNFKDLDQRLHALETGRFTAEAIQEITLEQDQLIIKGSRGSVFGPFTLPTPLFKAKGEWQEDTPYTKGDVVQKDLNLYQARHDHVGDKVFEAKNWQLIFQALPQTESIVEKSPTQKVEDEFNALMHAAKEEAV